MMNLCFGLVMLVLQFVVYYYNKGFNMFALIENGIVTKYPVDDIRLRKEFCSEVILPVNLQGCEYLVEQGWVQVEVTNRPQYDELTEYIVEDIPIFVDNVWIQSWLVKKYDIEIITNKEQEIFKQKINEIIQVVDNLINKTAIDLQYDSKESLCTYVNSTIPKFNHEANIFIVWRDNVWAKCLEIQNDVMNGIRVLPTIEELLLELPKMVL